jgi:uncharacterized protein YgiM (DUF1202 family)
MQFAVAIANVNLRNGPGTDAPILATIPAGSRVQVTDCSEWCMVTWNGQSGFAVAATSTSEEGVRREPADLSPAMPVRRPMSMKLALRSFMVRPFIMGRLPSFTAPVTTVGMVRAITAGVGAGEGRER